MGSTGHTRKQMAKEGLTEPANFEDFSKKLDLDALFKLLLKSVKVAGGTTGTGSLKKVASYAIPAKS